MNKWRYYGNYYRGLFSSLAFGILGSIGQSLMLLAIPLLFKYGIDTVIPGEEFSRLILVGAAIIGLYLISGGIHLATRKLVLKITKQAVQRFRDELLKKLIFLPRTAYTEVDRDVLHTRIVQDTERLDVMSNALIVQLIPSLLAGVILCLLMVVLNWSLFAVLFLIMPVLYLISRRLGRRVRSSVRSYHRSFEKFSKGVFFIIQMLDLMRIQAAENLELSSQRRKVEDLRVTSEAMALWNTAYVLVQDTVIAVAGVIVLVVGGVSVARGSMSLGELISFYVAMGLLKNFFRMLSVAIPQVIQGAESLTALMRIIDFEERNPYRGKKKIIFNGNIEMEAVSFRYQDQWVLQDVDLSVTPGAITGIVGPNAAGKTTVLNLLLGFYRPDQGRLLAGGIEYDDIDLTALRRAVGVVTQKPLLFSGTILENIVYGVPDADMKDIEAAARLAIAHTFIESLPEGYDTSVGEGGISLSGGQQQRIAMARAVLRRAPLLILDEPTNHLDNDVSRRLIANLKSIPGRPAVLIITHDRNVIAACSRVSLLREGRVVAEGDSAEVMREVSKGFNVGNEELSGNLNDEE